MKILNINFSNTNNYHKNAATQNSTEFSGMKLMSLQQDVVSFGAKSKKDKNNNNKQSKAQHQKSTFEQACIKGNKNPNTMRKKIHHSIQSYDPKSAQEKRLEKQRQKEEAEQRLVEQKLEYEHKKAELRKKYIRNGLQVRIKNQIISDKELLFILNKIKECPDLVNETFIEPDNGELLFSMSDNVMKAVLESAQDYQVLVKMVETPDAEGKLFMEKIPETKLRCFNDALSQMQTVLITAYLTENKDKQLPAHYLSLDGLRIMNEKMSDYPALLAQIYTHTDNIGNTPMHNRFKKGQSIIKDALSFQPETIARIRKIRNRYDEYPETILKKAEKYSGPYEETWKIILNEF